jgi:hypothetical protein
MSTSDTCRPVTFVREGRETSAIAQTSIWSIVQSDDSRPLPWEAMILLPPEIATEPLVFPSCKEAWRWVEANSRVQKKFEWSGLEARATDDSDGFGGAPFSKVGDDNTLTLYSGYDCTGTRYKVQAKYPVTDWAAQLPARANVPSWMPKSCSSKGQSDVWGNDYGKPRGRRLIAFRGEHSLDDLPFSEVVCAYTNSD